MQQKDVPQKHLLDMVFKTGKKDLLPHFCEWLQKAHDWAATNPDNMLVKGWENAGLMIAWDTANPDYVTLKNEAIRLAEDGTLWNNISDKEAPSLPSTVRHVEIKEAEKDAECATEELEEVVLLGDADKDCEDSEREEGDIIAERYCGDIALTTLTNLIKTQVLPGDTGCEIEETECEIGDDIEEEKDLESV